MDLKTAIGKFFLEYSKFEMHSVGLALRALSKDEVFVAHAEQLLDLEARLRLIERLAFARGIPAGPIAELETCLLRARKLKENRDEVTRSLAAMDLHGVTPGRGASRKTPASRRLNADFSRPTEMDNLWMPALARVEEHALESIDLQRAFGDITRKLEDPLPAAKLA